MNKRLKGFSLAELLISLLIISIVLSAAIPTLTRKSGANREFIWSWSTQNNSAYFGLGANQTAIIGYDKNPITAKISAANLLADLMYDSNDINNSYVDNAELRKIDEVNIGQLPFNGHGDRLVLLKRSIIAKNTANPESNFVNSHISFYTLKNIEGNSETTPPPTTDDIKYGGRITMDQGNIAMGIGSLQNQDWDKSDSKHLGENTAIGHFALLRNDAGIRNTAIGKKTLSSNEGGSYNTALGFGSLFNLGSVKVEGILADTTNAYFDNTAIGAYSQQYNNLGKENTSVGTHSLKNLMYDPTLFSETSALGNANTAVGFGAFMNMKSGDENTALGKNACANTIMGSNNICIGSYSGYSMGEAIKHDNFGVYIGSSTTKSSTDEAYENGSAPLINGHSRRTTVTTSSDSSKYFDQELAINAKQVIFRPFNATFDAFKFESMIGKPAASDSEKNDEGYGVLGQPDKLWGRAWFNLRDTLNADSTSVSMRFRAEGGAHTGANNKIAMIDAFDPYNITSWNASDINLNGKLTFSFPTPEKVHINGENVPLMGGSPYTKYTYPVILNHAVAFEQDDSTTYDSSTEYPSFKLKKDSSTSIWTSIFEYGDTKIKTAKKTNEANLDFSQEVANKNYINVSQKGTESHFNINQTGTSNKQFMVKQGTGEHAPRLQMNNGSFEVNDVNYAKIKASGGVINLGSGGDDNDICYGSACLKKVADAVQNLQTQVGSLSDIRLKNVIGDNTAGLKEINALEVKDYTFKNDKEKTPHVGVIAQQLQKIFPNAVTKGEDGYLRIRTEDIFYAMVNSIKDLFKQIQDLTAKVTGLDKRLTALEEQNKLLQEQNKLLKKQNKAIEKRLAKLEKKAAK